MSSDVAFAPKATTMSVTYADVEALYAELGPYAVSKTTYLVGNADVAEEIVQEVFLRLWQKRLSFPTRRQAYQWVYVACHNAGIDHLRRQRRAGPQVEWTSVPELRAPDDPAARLSNRQQVVALLGRLSERDARIVAARFVDGAEHKDIADRLGVSEKTVRRALAGVQELIATWKRNER